MAKLYSIRPHVKRERHYDVYLEAIVVANSEHEAARIHPSGHKFIQYVEVNDVEGFHWVDTIDGWHGYDYYPDEWAYPSEIDVTYIGEASPEYEAGTVILSSYNAG